MGVICEAFKRLWKLRKSAAVELFPSFRGSRVSD